ncbi:MAG: DivIVA domain-containing protein [Lachnospiraceae bacterium]|nr:DivIVA domain-containing protein [Lachnospiraceae bacterium]
MITPVDFRQKSFRTGIGYDKKDVDSFMAELLRNYEELYRSNAQQIADIKDLDDNLKRYQAMEDELSRQLMVAEKNAEQIVKDAESKATVIEAEAKKKAKEYIRDCNADMIYAQEQTVALARMHASLKAQLNILLKNYVDFINSDKNGIDINKLDVFGQVPDEIKQEIGHAQIVPDMEFSSSALLAGKPAPKKEDEKSKKFDPFANINFGEEEKTLGGGPSPSIGGRPQSSGKTLSSNDPFKGISVESTNNEMEERRDPFAGIDVQSTNEAAETNKDPFAALDGYSNNESSGGYDEYNDSSYQTGADESYGESTYQESAGYDEGSYDNSGYSEEYGSYSEESGYDNYNYGDQSSYQEGSYENGYSDQASYQEGSYDNSYSAGTEYGDGTYSDQSGYNYSSDYSDSSYSAYSEDAGYSSQGDYGSYDTGGGYGSDSYDNSGYDNSSYDNSGNYDNGSDTSEYDNAGYANVGADTGIPTVNFNFRLGGNTSGSGGLNLSPKLILEDDLEMALEGDIETKVPHGFKMIENGDESNDSFSFVE